MLDQLPKDLLTTFIAIYRSVQQLDASKKHGLFTNIKKFFVTTKKQTDRSWERFDFCRDFFVELQPVLLKIAYRCYKRKELSSTADNLAQAIGIFDSQLNTAIQQNFDCVILTDEIRIVASFLAMIKGKITVIKESKIDEEKTEQLFGLINRMLDCSNSIARFSYPDGRKISMAKMEKEALLFPYLLNFINIQSDFIKETCFVEALKRSLQDQEYDQVVERLASELKLKTAISLRKAREKAEQIN